MARIRLRSSRRRQRLRWSNSRPRVRSVARFRHTAAMACEPSTTLRPARKPAASTTKQPMESAPIRRPRWVEVQLQLVRYDGLPRLTLQLQGMEHVLETRSAPRRPVRAPRRPLNDAAAYADLALAGAASAPFHPQACTDCAKAGAANAMANATAAISVFMVSLHQTHLR